MNIEVYRALIGDYKDLIIKKKGIKCYGYRHKAISLEEIDYLDGNRILEDIIFDFARIDFVSWQSDANSEVYDILTRRDEKTLRIDKSLLAFPNNSVFNILHFKAMQSIINILDNLHGYLEIRLEKEKLVMIDKLSNNICFSCNHCNNIDLIFILNYLFKKIKNKEDIQVNYLLNKPVNIGINTSDLKIRVISQEKDMAYLTKLTFDYQDMLQNNNYQQLKMEGF